MTLKPDISSRIRKIQKDLQKIPSISGRLNHILEVTLSLFEATTGSISITNKEEKVLTIVAAKGMDWEKKIAAKLPLDMGITGRAASLREIVYVPDVSKEPTYIKLIDSVKSELAIPLATRTETIGVLNLESDKLDFFKPDSINEANLFASQLTILLLEERIATEAVAKQKVEEDPVEELLGYDPQVLFLKNRIRQIGPSDVTVFLSGEEGVGKSLVAKTIHLISPRKDKPFLTLHCGGLHHDLLEKELFGTMGVLEKANQGTLYLSSIGSLPMDLQARLLYYLKEKNKELGFDSSLNVRLIVGSTTDLQQELQSNLFSMELYYRLAECPIRIPSLRDRRGDIPLLVQHFLWFYNQQYGKTKQVSPDGMRSLISQPWTGNVRQLQSTIQYAILVPPEEVLVPESFERTQGMSESFTSPPSAGNLPRSLVPGEQLSLNQAVEKLEAIWIQEAFQRVSTQEDVAKLLEISRGALQYKIKNNPFLSEKRTDF